MKNLLKSFAAVALALGGVLVALSAPASAAGKSKTVTCYKLVSNKVQSHKFKNAKGVCGKGWSKHKPTPKPVAVGSLQGSNKSGDIDLVVPSSVSLAINGSSFDAPMIGATTSGSTAYSAGGKVTFSSYPAAGSGTGRTSIANGSVDIGFSDQPMTPGAGTLPGGVTESNYVQVPYILGGAVVGYNLGASLNNIQLTSNELAKIFDGQITQWSNLAIINTNGGLSSPTGKALQALYTSHASSDNIKVIYRNASSGTTYAFTDYLHSSGGSSHNPSGNVMEGTGNAWHAPNILGAANNAAMATDINSNPGAIGYVEYSYLLIPGNAAIQTASLQDREGVWLQPSLANIAAAGAAAGSNITPDNFSIVNEGGKNVWPLATYSWAIVPKNETNAGKGEAVVKYLDWETHYAQSALAKAEGYVPLPAAVAAYAREQLLLVTSGGNVLLTSKS
jgi:phosphate transport system substrate-binding protein